MSHNHLLQIVVLNKQEGKWLAQWEDYSKDLPAEGKWLYHIPYIYKHIASCTKPKVTYLFVEFGRLTKCLLLH